MTASNQRSVCCTAKQQHSRKLTKKLTAGGRRGRGGGNPLGEQSTTISTHIITSLTHTAETGDVSNIQPKTPNCRHHNMPTLDTHMRSDRSLNSANTRTFIRKRVNQTHQHTYNQTAAACLPCLGHTSRRRRTS